MPSVVQNGGSQLLLGDDHLVLDFAYDRAQVAEVKQIPGATWDRTARVWRLPITALDRARAFALQHRFWIDPAVTGMHVHAAPTPDATVTIDGEWLILTAPYDSVRSAAAQALPGCTWHARSATFRAPLDAGEAVLDWAERFRVEVQPEVRSVVHERGAAARALREHSRATTAEVHIDGLGGTLRPYQAAGVAYAVTARRCFLADEMGLGKTPQALAALEAAHQQGLPAYPAVIVAPPTLLLNWATEARRWVPQRSVAVIRNRTEFPAPADLLIVSWANIAAHAERLSGHASYVYDESHYAKTPTAQRTKAAVRIARDAPGLVLCLTGTPITNRPAEYAPQLDILGRLGDYGGLWAFYRRFCAAYRDRWGQWHVDGAAHLDELQDRLRSSCFVRRTKTQVLSELPAVVHDTVLVEPDPKAMGEYRRAEADIAAFMAARAAALAAEMGANPRSAAVLARIKAESAEHLVRLSQLRRLAAKAKHTAITEWVAARVDAGQKVVIAAHHRDVVDALAGQWGALKIQGGMAVEDVEAAKARFQGEPCAAAPVIVLSMQAAKTGHTLTAAQDVLFVELPWTPADVDQTYSRCHRLGQQGSVTATYLLAEGTIDEDIHALITAKRAVVDAATDGTVVDAVGSVGAELVARFTQRALG